MDPEWRRKNAGKKKSAHKPRGAKVLDHTGDLKAKTLKGRPAVEGHGQG